MSGLVGASYEGTYPWLELRLSSVTSGGRGSAAGAPSSSYSGRSSISVWECHRSPSWDVRGGGPPSTCSISAVVQLCLLAHLINIKDEEDVLPAAPPRSDAPSAPARAVVLGRRASRPIPRARSTGRRLVGLGEMGGQRLGRGVGLSLACTVIVEAPVHAA